MLGDATLPSLISDLELHDATEHNFDASAKLLPVILQNYPIFSTLTIPPLLAEKLMLNDIIQIGI